MNEFVNRLTVQGMAGNIKEVRKSQTGKHILKAITSEISNSDNVTVMLDYQHNINEDYGICDWLRFSNYQNFSKSFDRIKYAFDCLSATKGYINQKITEGKLINIVEVLMINGGVGQPAKPYTVTLNRDELWTASNEDGDVYKAKLTEWYSDQRSVLDEGYELVSNPAEKTMKKVTYTDENGKTKQKSVVSSEVLYACRLQTDKIQEFANQFVELGNELVNKLVTIEIIDTENTNRSRQIIVNYAKA